MPKLSVKTKDERSSWQLYDSNYRHFLFVSQLLRKIRPKKHDKVTCLFPHNYAIKLGQGSSDISKTIIPLRWVLETTCNAFFPTAFLQPP